MSLCANISQTDLRDKFDRLEKDHSEADTHIQVISERHAKREADLRETLQVLKSKIHSTEPVTHRCCSLLAGSVGTIGGSWSRPNRYQRKFQCQAKASTCGARTSRNVRSYSCNLIST